MRVYGVLLTSFLLCLLNAFSASAGAPQPLGSSVNMEQVYVKIDPSANTVKAAIGDGRKQWNRSACNATGVDFPVLSKTPVTGMPTVTIKTESGTDPNIDDGNPTLCGLFEGPNDGSSGTITLFSQFISSDGVTRDCDIDAFHRGWVSDLVAHELGHYLGLAESSCADGSIMGPAAYNGSFATNRKPSDDECNMVDTLNSTQTEDELEECPDGNTECGGQNDGSSGSPILLDLANDGFALTGLEDPVFFDIDGDRQLESVSWTQAGAIDGFLCWDRNTNGRIDDGRELFGTGTRLLDGSRAAHGYLPLAELDSVSMGGSQDQLIDDADLFFSRLCVWFDLDHNGSSEPSEIYSLAEVGVTSLSTRFWESEKEDAHGNQFSFGSEAKLVLDKGVRRTIPTVDVFFLIGGDWAP